MAELIIAMALGFIVAWFTFKLIHDKKEASIIDKLSKDLKNSEKLFSEKSSHLETLQNKLIHLDAHKDDTVAVKEENHLLLSRIQQFEQSEHQRVKELEDFENILVLAEEKIEENEQNYKKILKNLDDEIESLRLDNDKYKKNLDVDNKKIKMLEEELTLYKADSSASEFIISRDQFVKIEEQLKRYQKEIETLKDENSQFLIKPQNILHELGKEQDDGSMVKAFKETYKKITNS